MVVLNSDAAEALRLLQIPDEFIVGVVDSAQKAPDLGFENKPSVGDANNPSLEKIIEIKPQAIIGYGTASTTSTWFRDNKDKLESAGIKVMKNIWTIYAQDTSGHQAMESAGGTNIARDMNGFLQVSTEWVLEKNPDKMFIGTYNQDVVGYKATDYTNAAKLRDSALSDPVISKTNAGKNKQVYIISSKLCGGCRTYLGTLYLAKWLYPERFKDVNPDQVLKEYFEKWLGIPMKGNWAYPMS